MGLDWARDTPRDGAVGLTPPPEAAPTLTVVVMAFNEQPSLESTCSELLDVVRRLDVSAELLVVDDGSNDGTGQLADALAERESMMRVVHHPQNLGLGGVYRTGFTSARGTCVTFFPADGQFPAAIIADFLPRMRDYEVVLGYLPDRTDTLVAKTLSYLERVLYRIIVGPLPRFQGVLMFRRELLQGRAFRSTGRGWGILMEFILQCSREGRRMISVPTSCRLRVHGESKVSNVRTILSILRQLWALRTMARPSSASVHAGGSGDASP